MLDYTILPANDSLIQQIAEIEKDTFSDPWSEHSLSAYLPDKTHDFFVAADPQGCVLGYVSFLTVIDEGYINNVAVRKEMRRCGVASSLITECIQRARERRLSFLTLEVRASNEAARSLYEKFGFQEVGRRPGYYEKPREDAILMTLFFETEANT